MPELQLHDQINMMLLKMVCLKEKTAIGTKFLVKKQGKYWLMCEKILELKNKWFLVFF